MMEGESIPGTAAAGLEHRAERSRAALAERFPALARLLASPPASLPVIEDDEIIDIDLGTRRLYEGDGRAVAADQVEAYMAKPLRFFVLDLSGTNSGSPVSAGMVKHLNAECARLGIAFDSLDAKPHYDGGLLIVLGLGLGHHLRPLIERTRAGHVVILEPQADFLRHSLAAIDWPDLLDWADQRDCTLTLTLPDSPDAAIAAIHAMINQAGAPLIDGAYVFLHYPALMLTELRDRLHNFIDLSYVSRGFFEDELLMVTNTMRNLTRHRFRLIDARLKPARDEPVFIIGSGPSIDEAIGHVKRLRDRAIVFSCGTALKVCLKHGIVPDFHSELENGPWTFESLTTTAGPEVLGQIALIGSLSIDPRDPALFEHRFLFFREGLSSTRMLAPPKTELFGVAPTVANTALRTAIALGFTRFYLFGVDCGSKSLERKHSVDSLYHSMDKLKAIDAGITMGYTIPGNFGGTARANWVFNFSRTNLGGLLTTYNVTAFNCSDGARIDGAVPKVPAAVTLSSPVIDRAAVKAAIRSLCRSYEPGEFLGDRSIDPWREEARRFFDDAFAMIDRAKAEDRDFIAFWSRISAFFKGIGNDYSGVHHIVRGSALSIPKIGMFFGHRIRDEALRHAMFLSFIDKYRETFEFMRDETLKLFDAVERDLAEPAVR